MIQGFRKNDKIISGIEKNQDYLNEYKLLKTNKKAFKKYFVDYINYLVDELSPEIDARKKEFEELNKEAKPLFDELTQDSQKELAHIETQEKNYKKQLLEDENIINMQLKDDFDNIEKYLDPQSKQLLSEFKDLESQALKDIEEQEAELLGNKK